MGSLLYMTCDGDDDANYDLHIGVSEDHFFLDYKFEALWAAYNEGPPLYNSLFAVLTDTPQEPIIKAYWQRAISEAEKEGRVFEYLVSESVSEIVAAFASVARSDKWVRMVEVVLKGACGKWDDPADLRDACQLEDRFLLTRLIEKNGGWLRFVEVLGMELIEEENHLTLYKLSESDYLLKEAFQENDYQLFRSDAPDLSNALSKLYKFYIEAEWVIGRPS